MHVSNVNQTGFCGLKANLRIGSEILQEFNQDFSKRPPRSFTKVQAKMLEHSGDPKYETIIEKLGRLVQKYMGAHQEVIEARQYRYDGSAEKKIALIRGDIKRFGYANCDEQAIIIYDKLIKRNIPAFNINMKIVDKVDESTVNKNHIFSIFGVKEGAKLSDIKTWGNEAVAVDAWSNTTKCTREAIESYKKTLGFDPEREKIIYEFYYNC